MEDKLRLNTKLYGFSGIVGRRDYFLNCVIIACISLFFVLPYQTWVLSHIQEMSDLLNLDKMFIKAPLLLKWWFLSGVPLVFILYASNIVRRLNDITGKVSTGLNLFILSICLLNTLSFIILPFGISCLLSSVGFILGLIILFKRGKITGKYPYDVTKIFNWGAFFGTWIWGLFNKSYKPLWMLLLFFTPWTFSFQLYCGLKGNEWAFKNKKWENVSSFNKSQKKQSTIFTILFLVIIPVLTFTILLLIGIAYGAAIAESIKNNPLALEKQISKMEGIYFDSHVITPNENKYYLSSSDWNRYSFDSKRKLFDFATSLASVERIKKYPNNGKIYSKDSEKLRTKIYDTKTNCILGEYVLDVNALEKQNIKDMAKASLNAYKFYNDKTSEEYIKQVNELKEIQNEYIKNIEKTHQSPYFDSYMKELQQEIKKNWNPPEGTESKNVVVLFSIMKDGTLLNVRIKKPSGIYEVDEAATNAVKLTFPFKALPSEYHGDRVEVEFTFDYKVLGTKNV